eukprot:TRINITY_DN5432_c0_g1_i1.p1 TRINITY_DN5432_c0_g1~~TRINITY_DN5432_c0_g1_i1.p1  ORF type:complete len:887 (+),score=315.96 TRINITY_DN5432_c0_g1_i1:533-3193(+)
MKQLKYYSDWFGDDLLKASKMAWTATMASSGKQPENINTYGLLIDDTNEWINRDQPLSSIQSLSQRQVFFSNKYYVGIRIAGQDATVIVTPYASVREIVKHIRRLPQARSISDWENTTYHIGDVELESSRPIRSYRLKPSDKIEVREPMTKQRSESSAGSNRVQDDKPIFVSIESTVHGISRAFKFPSRTTVGQVLAGFLEKYTVTNPDDYSLKRVARGANTYSSDLKEQRKREEQEGVWLPHEARLLDLKLTPWDCFVFQEKVKKQRVKSMAPKTNVCFGVDITRLEHVYDPENGMRVPKVLMDLKKAFAEGKGYDELGIFRIAGSESAMKEMKSQLNTGTFLGSKDVHSVATVIKRFFAEMPVRLFAYIESEDIKAGSESQKGAVKAISTLPDQEREIFMWLIDLLTEVTRRQDVNKMSEQNLAIVVAPPLMDVSDEDPVEALFLTQECSALVKHMIEYRLKERYNIQRTWEPTQEFINSITPQLSDPINNRMTFYPSANVDKIHQNSTKEGFLLKESDGVITELKRRWYILSDHFIYGFKTRQDRTPAETIPLKGSSVKPKKMGTRVLIEIYTPGKVYHFFCENSAELKEWTDAIQESIDAVFREAMQADEEKPKKENSKEKTGGNSAEILREGYMFKKGGGGAWQRRYFILKDYTLYYHVEKEDPLPVGSINVLTCSAKETKFEKKKAFFDIITPKKTYSLFVEGKEEMDGWISAIRSVGTAYLGADGNTAPYEPPPPVNPKRETQKKEMPAISSTPIKKDLRKERQSEIDQILTDPTFSFIFVNPQYHAVLLSQYNSFVEGRSALNAMAISKFWLDFKKRKDDLEMELRNGHGSLVELLTSSKCMKDVHNVMKNYLDPERDDQRSPSDIMYELRQVASTKL